MVPKGVHYDATHRQSWVGLGVVLGKSWGGFGAQHGAQRFTLGPVLEPLGAALGRSWDGLGAQRGAQCPGLRYAEDNVGGSWAVLGRS